MGPFEFGSGNQSIADFGFWIADLKSIKFRNLGIEGFRNTGIQELMIITLGYILEF